MCIRDSYRTLCTFCRVQNVSQNLQKFRVLYRICYKSHRNFGYCTGSPTEAFVKIGYCVKVVQIPEGLCWKCYRTYTRFGYCAERRINVTKSSGTGTFEEKYPRYPLWVPYRTHLWIIQKTKGFSQKILPCRELNPDISRERALFWLLDYKGPLHDTSSMRSSKQVPSSWGFTFDKE